MAKTCPTCGEDLQFVPYSQAPVCVFCDDDEREADNGPTGHGDECYSDADPGF